MVVAALAQLKQFLVGTIKTRLKSFQSRRLCKSTSRSRTTTGPFHSKFKKNEVSKPEIYLIMEDGGVDTTVIDSREHNMGRMADFSPLVASPVFDL